MSLKNYYVSTYASSPSPTIWDADKEADYFAALANNPQIIGIEHPFCLDDEKYPLPWLLKHIPSHWRICITAIPVFMNMSQSYPHIGMASADEQGRHMAITLISDIHRYVEKLNLAFGRNIVKALHLQSFPRQPGSHSNQNAFIESLHTIKHMHWQDTELNIEHCDAYVPGQPAEKGFLTLEDEISAISAVGGYGVLLNWARSAIECRHIEGPLKHIDYAIAHKLLKGFFFSGCDNQVTSAYGQWVDSHMPPQNSIGGTCLPLGGLLDKPTLQTVWQHLAACASAPYLGIKITNRGAPHSVERSVGLTLESMAALDAACAVR